MSTDFQLISTEIIAESLLARSLKACDGVLSIPVELLLIILEQLPIYEIFNFCLAYPELFSLAADHVIKQKLAQGIHSELEFIFTSLFKGDFPGRSFVFYSDVAELDGLDNVKRKYETEYRFEMRNSGVVLITKTRLSGNVKISSEENWRVPDDSLQKMAVKASRRMVKNFPEGLKLSWF